MRNRQSPSHNAFKQAQAAAQESAQPAEKDKEVGRVHAGLLQALKESKDTGVTEGQGAKSSS